VCVCVCVCVFGGGGCWLGESLAADRRERKLGVRRRWLAGAGAAAAEARRARSFPLPAPSRPPPPLPPAFHQITAHRAGHVLGAAMFSVDIEGVVTLYTGDYSRVADRHLPAADTPARAPDIRERRPLGGGRGLGAGPGRRRPSTAAHPLSLGCAASGPSASAAASCFSSCTHTAAPLPPQFPALPVIVKSTYGVSRHLVRDVREKRFLSLAPSPRPPPFRSTHQSSSSPPMACPATSRATCARSASSTRWSPRCCGGARCCCPSWRSAARRWGQGRGRVGGRVGGLGGVAATLPRGRTALAAAPATNPQTPNPSNPPGAPPDAG
jgi:hypothetical protein